MSANLHCHRFAVLLSLCTWILIWAGALVTSTESGLAVPDWPLSYGMLMPPMVGGILFEHGHRMVATFVGLLTVILALWLWRRERRPWVRRLGALAVVLVIAQGVLGGITVLYFLPAPVSVAHATLAQTFFCLTILLAFASRSGREKREAGTRRLLCAHRGVVTGASTFSRPGAVDVTRLGARDRFPRFRPPRTAVRVPRSWSFVHRLERWWWRCACFSHSGSEEHRDALQAGLALFCLALAQIVLGGAIVWTSREVVVATAHVATGALILATAWLTTLRAHAHLIPPQRPE
jgi:cytochrome c oxidase assembly protein subunit 15